LNEPLTKSIRSVDLVTAGIGRLIEDTTVAMDRNRELHREGRPGIRRPAVALLGIVYARLNRREDADRSHPGFIALLARLREQRDRWEKVL
jgi:hypothetical protein